MKELLSLDTATPEQKFMLMLCERVETLEDRVGQLEADKRPREYEQHSFEVQKQPKEEGAYIAATLWQDAVACSTPDSKLTLSHQLGIRLSAELAALNMPAGSQLFIAAPPTLVYTHLVVPVGEAPPDLLPRHLLTATVFLTWSGQAVALDQVAAAVEAAWGEALVPIGLSREELFSTRYSSEAWWNKLTVPKIERCIVELPLPSLLLKMVKLVATEFHDGAGRDFECKIFSVTQSSQPQWAASDANDGYTAGPCWPQIGERSAHHILNATDDLEFMRGGGSDFGHWCWCYLRCAVDIDFDY